jgi:hypothetical protein
MLLRLFRSKSTFVYIILLIFAVIVFYGLSFQFITYKQNQAFLLGYNLLEWFDFTKTSIDYVILGFFFFFLQAILVSALSARFNLLAEVNILPSFIYLLLLSQQASLLVRPDVAIAFIFINLSFFYLFSFYSSNAIHFQTFQLGLLVGIAFLFMFDSLFFALLTPILIMFVRGKISFREIGTYIFGFFVPLYFYSTLYFLINKSLAGVGSQISQSLNTVWPIAFHLSNYIITLLFLFILFLLANYKYFKIKRVKISVRRSFQMLAFLFFTSIISYFILPFFSETLWGFTLIPFSLLLSLLFIQIKHKWIAEVLFMLFIAIELLQLFGIFNKFVLN